jgi:mono/diheme cytochrome c family protein
MFYIFEAENEIQSIMIKSNKITALMFALPIVFTACNFQNPADLTANPEVRLGITQNVKLDEPPYDEEKGIGQYDASNTTAGALNAAMVTKGQEVFEGTCAACHTLTHDQVVGPGLKDITKKRKIYWLMNYLANPDPMIDKDPELQATFKKLGMRMANPNLKEDEIKAVVEYLRKNDGAK